MIEIYTIDALDYYDVNLCMARRFLGKSGKIHCNWKNVQYH